MIDRFTNWVEAVPLTTITAESAARAFINHWVSRYGVPTIIISYRGAQFESSLWAKLLSRLGINRRRTTAYHPQCNGLVERFHRVLKDSLRAACDKPSWSDSLPLVLLGLRSSVGRHGYSPSQLLYGSELTLPGEFFAQRSTETSYDRFSHSLFEKVASFRPPERRHAKASFVPNYDTATHAWLRKPVHASMERPYAGPYLITSKNDKTLTLMIKNQPQKVSIDRTKPAILWSTISSISTTSPSGILLKAKRTPNSIGTKRVRFSPKVFCQIYDDAPLLEGGTMW
jgi:hypothetical protein